MLFLARNQELVTDREKTYLTADADASATSLTVKAVDTNSMANNDYLIVGEIGSENAEIMQINDGSFADGTTIAVDRSGAAGGLRYDHSTGEPVYRTPYNRVQFLRNTTDTSVGSSQLALNEIQPDDLFTRFEDTTNTTGFGFLRFNNETTAANSSFSDGIPYTGYGPLALGRIIRMIRRHLGEPDFNVITDEDILEEVNEKQRDIAHERLWPFYEDIRSDSRVAFQREYDIDDDVVIGKPHTITVESEPMAKIDAHRFDTLYWDTATTGEPTHASIWQNQIRFYPTPPSAATTTAINDSGNISATVTTITVDSTSGFSPSGRMIIESEVIAYTNTTSTTFRGCTRGLEETTAATHADDVTITERDIVYTVNREPNELLDSNDQTLIPDPAVLVYGSAAELALGILSDQSLHDRLKTKYDQSIGRLRDKFGQKFTYAHYRIKDKTEVVTDLGRFKDPNDPVTQTIST